MTGAATFRRWWVALLLLGLAGSGAFLFVRHNPFWLVERGTDLYLWKNHVAHHELMVNGQKIHYLEAAPSQAGPDKPIVLIHGLGARASDWSAIIPALATAGYHVYALDLLGYGHSAQPRDGDFSLSGEEAVTVAFMSALHVQQADVAGWSMGGWIAMKLALDHPDQVRRLLLFDSAGLYMAVHFPLSLFNPSTPAELDALIDIIEPEHHIIHIPNFAVKGLLHDKQRTAWIVNASLASMLDGHEILDFRAHNLQMPVLLVWGTEDKLTPLSTAAHLHELVPQSVLVELAGCGHLAAAECAHQAIPATINFLNAEPPPPPSILQIPQLKAGVGERRTGMVSFLVGSWGLSPSAQRSNEKVP